MTGELENIQWYFTSSRIFFNGVESIYSAKYYLGMTGELENIQWYFTRRFYYICRLDCNHDYLDRINHLQLENLELQSIYNDLYNGISDSTQIHRLK